MMGVEINTVTRATSPRVTRLVGRWDVPLLAAILILTAIGLLLVLSTTINPTADLTDAERWFKFNHQLLAVGIGIAAMLGLKFIPPRILWYGSILVLVASVPLFLLMKYAGIAEVVNGSPRWIDVLGMSLQPSELTKVAWAIFVCGFIAWREDSINSWKRTLGWILGALAPIFISLVLLHDVGSAVIMAAIMLMMLIVAGMNLLNLAIFGAVGVFGLAGVMYFDQVKLFRILAYLFPEYVRQGIGYQLSQSELAIGSGGLFGTGLGHGIVHVWSNLPESENDMIIAVAGEELGFVGLVCICLLYAIIAVRGLRIARMSQSKYRRNLAFLMTMLICLPASMHLCVNVGLIPAKGLVCPFMSYGGTAMITSFACLGILQRLHIDATAERRISEEFLSAYEPEDKTATGTGDGGSAA